MKFAALETKRNKSKFEFVVHVCIKVKYYRRVRVNQVRLGFRTHEWKSGPWQVWKQRILNIRNQAITLNQIRVWADGVTTSI